MKFPAYVTEMLERLYAAGYSAYAVGGCVRDSLLLRVPNDWDVTTSAKPAETEAVFADPRYSIRTGNGLRHGTVTVSLAGEPSSVCEITTYRTEGEYTDHRRPDSVAFVTDIREDLSRRDFTVNAMAAAPLADASIEILDPFGGQEDLKAGVLRCVGDPFRRFHEDALRILRGLRFAARYRFEVEKNTAAGMRSLAPLLDRIAPERVGAELIGIFSGAYCGRIAEEFGDIFLRILPGCILEGAEEILFRSDSWMMRLALLCRSCDPQQLRELLLHYALGKETAERMLRWITYRDAPLTSHRDLCVLADVFGASLPEYFTFRMALEPDSAELRTARENALALLRPGVCYNVSTLAVNGRDLLVCGVAAGPAVGEILGRLAGEVIGGELPNERDPLLERARAIGRILHRIP